MLQTVVLPPNLQEPFGFSLPAIFDEDAEHYLLEQALSRIPRRYEELLDRASEARLFLSMPTPPKSHSSKAKDYDTTASIAQEMYLAHPQPGLGHPHISHFDVPYTQPSEGHPYTASAAFQHRRVPPPDAAYGELQPRSFVPQVTRWARQETSQGTTILVDLAFVYELDESWTFEIGPEDQPLPCILTANEPKAMFYEYTLSAEIPAPLQISWANYKAVLTLQGRDNLGNSTGVITLGDFTHSELIHQSARSSPSLSRKRRLSGDGDSVISRKRALHGLRAASESAFDRQQYGISHANYENADAILSLETAAAEMVNSYPRVGQPLIHHKSPTHMHIPNSASSVGSMPRPSPQTPTWDSVPSSSTRSPVAAVTHSRKATAASMSPIVSHPKLCRTTTLQQTPSPPAGPSGSGQFNPYAMLPYNKAILKINGELEDMTKNWSPEELSCQRRLVHFMREQAGNTINTTFKPVTPEERQPNFICISCIWWELKKEYYITSVDTIYLLENLVGGRFTVEEKNRIRRNLEGFRPMTVSKGKADSEDFFRLIMGFPTPKPRNIEKDVKVFPWKILSHALKKILGKYSASYSSMASALPGSIPNPQDFVGGILSPSSPHGSETPISAAFVPDAGTPGLPSMVPGRVSATYIDTAPTMVSAGAANGYPMYHFSGAEVVPASNSMAVMQPQPLQQHPSYRPGAWEMPPTYVHSSSPNSSEHPLYKIEASQNDAHYSMAQTSSSA